ncbi:MAG TPA: hypothetical protein VHC67_01540 [Gaiellaceae bacterium]|nr:hypothetical protein [Gaiellaceae bacterium]
MQRLLVAALAALAFAPSAFAAAPVPSLTPAATHRLWLAETARAGTHPRAAADASCRPARVIFYAQTDWLRLATKLAADPSACAQYYVSVPPLAADKTQARAGQAVQIRALGPSFHALDEISWNGWNGWVTAGNGTWYDAGVLARQRMAAAGFSTAAGDTWALNELSSAVRAGSGTARQNALEFMRGLASDGVKGVVFTTGVNQSADPTSYKVNLQGWLSDDGFWSAVSQYASDWAQESYGDLRTYAVAGSTPQQRRDQMLQYLGHELALANANPNQAAASRPFLQSAYVAFGNAAWAWVSAYGYTSAPVESMEDFVSGQVDAARSLGAPSGVDRFGFAWAPSNTLGLATGDFNAQTATVLDRLAAAIHDSDTSPDNACSTFCTTSLPGAAFTTAWQAFSTWALPGLAFTTPPATLAAGASTALTVAIATAGVPQVQSADVAVALSTTSLQGGFSTSPTGPFTPALTATIPAGGSSATVYYSDRLAGSATVSAALAGQAPATQTETVTAAPLAKLTVVPATATVYTGATLKLAASGADAFGNPLPVTPAWSVSSTAAGHMSGATFVAAKSRTGRVVVTAASGAVKGAALITVALRPPHVVVGTKSVAGHLVVTAKVLRGRALAPGVALTLRVRKGSSTIAVVKAKTGKRGTIVWRSRSRLPRGHYVVKALIRSASTASRTQHSST